MKKITLLTLSTSVFTLAACNSGGPSSNPASPSTNSANSYQSQALSARSAVSPSSDESPEINTNDIKLIFNALATNASKTEIDTSKAVSIITGKDPQSLETLKNLNTSGYTQALANLKALGTYPVNSDGSQAQYNEALFAAIFIADVTDSTNGSDGTNELGSITLATTNANLDMVAHRFYGGHRLAEQHYTWSVNPGTFNAILNNNGSLGNASDVSYLNIHQGAVGDCYFLSTLGALINARGNQAVFDKITQNGQSYSVSYTSIHSVGSSVNIGPVTDLEVATGAYSNGSGNWLTAFEQAYGEVLMSGEYNYVYFGKNIPTNGIYSLPTFYDGMIAANLPIGQYYPAFKFLTGHEVYEFDAEQDSSGNTVLKNEYMSTDPGYVSINNQNIAPSDMINIIDQSLQQNRVVVLGTPTDTKELNPGDSTAGAVTLPIDIVGTHAYAVLGHKDGKFILRNPWGTNFTPTGPDGLQNGYTMVDGVFSVPDEQIFQIFNQVDIEQLPGLDATPEVKNGQVVLSAGNPVYQPGTSSLFANYYTSNQNFIDQNFTNGTISGNKL